MHNGYRWFASILACALLANATQAQDDEETRAEIQELRREVQALKARLDTPDARHGRSGFMSFLGEHINIKGRLEFEFWSVGNENKVDYRPEIGRLKGTDFRIDSLTLWTDVKFIQDVYLRTEVELQGASENKDPDARDDFLLDINEAFFAFDNILQHLGGLDDPLHTFIRFGAIRPWQYQMFPRSTETYGLPQTSFYRDYRTGVQIGGELREGLFYRAMVDDGNHLRISHAGDRNVGYAPILRDYKSNQGPSNHKDFELALGWRGEPIKDHLSITTGTWFRMGRLSHLDKMILNDAEPRLGLGRLDGSNRKRRFGWIGAVAYETDDWIGAFQAEWHRAWDANLHRQAYALQPSLKLKFADTFVYDERAFFSSFEMLYRFSNLRLYGRAPTNRTVPDSALAGADRWMHTFAGILELTKNVKVSAEYTFFQQSARNSVKNNEFLIHLGIGF